MKHTSHSLYALFALSSLTLPMTGCSLFTSNAQAQSATSESTTSASVSESTGTTSNVTPSATTASTANGPAAGTETSQNSQTIQTNSYKVDDLTQTPQVQMPDETEVQKAASDLEQAQTAIANSAFAQAFALASASYIASPTSDARALALYAASRLTPIELMRLDQKASTHFEQAVIGQLRLNICAAQQDNACIQDVLPRTVQSFEMLGDTETANQIRSFQTTPSSMHPVVAVLLPLSGNDRKIGRAMLGSMLQASGIYNHQSLPFDLRFFDTQSTNKTIENLIDQAKEINAQLILGPIDIRESMTASQKLDDQTVMIGFSPNDEFIRQKSNVFQFSYALPEEVQQTAKLLVSINAGNVISIGPDDAYTTTASTQLQNSLPSNIKFTPMTFPANQTDLRDMAKKIAKSLPDAVFLPTTADVAERITSFMAQENVWCKTPGTPAPKAVADMRKFVTCVSTSAWAPISAEHKYKFITDAIYLDYMDAVSQMDAAFGTSFENLYHRQPSVQEVMPYMTLSMLKTLPDSAWKSKTALETAIFNLFRSQHYLMIPEFRQVTQQSSQPYKLSTNPANTASRTLVNAK